MAPEMRIEIYGPTGLRSFIRTCLMTSQADMRGQYIVHELVPLQKQYPRGIEKVSEQKERKKEQKNTHSHKKKGKK